MILLSDVTMVDAFMARLAQSAERKALNLVVVGSSPTVGVSVYAGGRIQPEPCRVLSTTA